MRQSLWLQSYCLAILAVSIAAGVRLPAAETPRAASTSTFDITGIVQTADGTRVAGAAVVLAGAERRGQVPKLLAHCYADCLTYAFSDESGEFSFKDVEGEVAYKLLVTHPGYGHDYTRGVGPDFGTVIVTLAPPKLKTIADDANLVWGRVVDSGGKAVAGAIVEPRGYMQGRNGLEGPMDDVAAVTVTDQEGRFAIPSAKRVTALHLVVHARGFASEFFSDVASGAFEQVIRLRRGVTLRGRVVHQGQPQSGIVVGAVWPDRHSGSYFGPWQSITDEGGRFELRNVTPEEEISVYTQMDSVKELGAATEVRLTGAEGDDLDLGDLVIGAGHCLRGRVVVSGARPLPANVRVQVWRTGPYDRTTVPVEADGRFEICDLPSELLHVRVWGFKPGTDETIYPWPFHLSKKNASLDPQNPQHLVGMLAADTAVTIELEPGKFEFPRSPMTAAESQRLVRALRELRQSPIRGIEMQVKPH